MTQHAGKKNENAIETGLFCLLLKVVLKVGSNYLFLYKFESFECVEHGGVRAPVSTVSSCRTGSVRW